MARDVFEDGGDQFGGGGDAGGNSITNVGTPVNDSDADTKGARNAAIAPVQSDLDTHKALTTTAHGGVIASGALDTDGTLAANSDAKVASQKAVKTYSDLKLAKASNLSDLANAGTARTNLGLGTAATHATGDYDASGAAAAAQAASQPLAANLTALGALGVDAILPWRVEVNPITTAALAVGTWGVAASGSQSMGGWIQNSSNAQNDERGWDLVLAAGTWELTLCYVKATSGGIATVMLDNVSTGLTIDTYNGSTAFVIVSAVSGITVASTGKRRVSLKAATKNASSSGYSLLLSWVTLRRTA